PGRINFCFEFAGPSYTNDTACSSSLAAIHLACNSLWRGDCDTAVAGGTNMIYTPDQMALTNLMTSFGIRPDVTVGHSLGEFAALYAAGVLSASDVVYLVGQRADDSNFADMGIDSLSSMVIGSRFREDLG
nr:polyketide synthase A - Aspergillus parasiticus (fragments) [Aspergillus parasiticus]